MNNARQKALNQPLSIRTEHCNNNAITAASSSTATACSNSTVDPLLNHSNFYKQEAAVAQSTSSCRPGLAANMNVGTTTEDEIEPEAIDPGLHFDHRELQRNLQK